MKILIVDDEEAISSSLARLFRQLGHTVACSLSGAEALEMLTHDGIELVITDIIMPRMNGIDFVRRMRAGPTLRDIPVVIFSGRDESLRTDELRELGAAVVLSKPPDIRALLSLVDDLTSGDRD